MQTYLIAYKYFLPNSEIYGGKLILNEPSCIQFEVNESVDVHLINHMSTQRAITSHKFKDLNSTLFFNFFFLYFIPKHVYHYKVDR